ncbi:hypothetical protein [Limosilactobacillus pontis]|uniref:hypothetical protein n=1 Tax=Limosilactobacillus pontis TaxID=35787 RepID=UPI0015E2D27D|nr:hypothetical protein [Limosilactobacillus pontis]
MKKTKFIDLTKLAKLRIDEETNAFRPNWDNTILMTAYDAERTFILTRDGSSLSHFAMFCIALPATMISMSTSVRQSIKWSVRIWGADILPATIDWYQPTGRPTQT